MSRRLVAFALWLTLGFSGQAVAETPAPETPAAPPAPPALAVTSTADHSKFTELQKPFTSGPQVTEACLSCHNQADEQVMHSIHYRWNYASEAGQELGKSVVINSFCGNVAGNEPRCTSCHAGYGWTDMAQAPPADPSSVDCLVCHDRSGQYAKSATGAGHPALAPVKPGTLTVTGAPAWPVDLARAAQSVSLPGRENCGSCHFYGGGGDNVKHGDLSSALFQPTRAVDVHMAAGEGELDFTCSTCHVEEGHDWAGSRYDVDVLAADGTGLPGPRPMTASCESCHDSDPHPLSVLGLKLDDHVDRVACQTCHIPEFARGGVATKTVWDWSTAGRLDAEGKPIAEHGYIQGDGRELHTYLSQKGNFAWGEDVVPYYAWFDGSLEYTLSGATIDPGRVVEINRITGEHGDGASRIWPFKRMVGRQAYDAGFNRLAYSHVWGPATDTAFWTNFDWGRAIEAGMEAAAAEYSGEFGFVDTHMYWPITHMVAPADEALGCADCHAEDGRLADLAGFYMPGTDPRSPVALIGLLLVLGTLGGVGIHAILRLITRDKGESTHG